MARIEKLQVQGIRSFGQLDTERQNVEFFSPLTLILGQNGCGKTTIIECLKYVTTGDPPPGSKNGASFVHDPKMAKENTVRGQVKLLFKTTDGTERIASRALEATQKLKGITVKTMDSSISTKTPDGRIKTVGKKCADLNADMFMCLGVSKPILNYVIFCHQEDSNWPLEEGKKVKDKFDEIFDSAKYKNCLNNIKDVRKTEMENAKMEGLNASHYKSDRELCRERERDLKKKKKSLEKTEAEIEEMKDQLKPLDQQYKDLEEEEKGFTHIQSKITEASTKLEYSRTTQRELRRKMPEVLPEEETETEIQARLDSLKEKNKQRQVREREILKEVEKMRQKDKSVEFKIQKNAASLGKLRSDKDKNEKDKMEREKLKGTVEDLLRITVESDSLVDDIKKEENKVNEKINKFKVERNKTEGRINDEIDEVKGEKVTLEEKKKRGQADLVETKGQIAKLRRELADLEGADDIINSVKKDIENKKLELEEERGKMDPEEVNTKIRMEREELSRLEREEDKMKDELTLLEEQQSFLQEMEYLNKDISSKEDKRKRIISKRNSAFLDIFQSMPDLKRLKSSFKTVQEKAESDLKEIVELKQRKETSITSKSEMNSQLKKDRALKMKKERELQAKVGNVLDCGEDLESEITKSKDRLESLRKELQVKEAGKFTYKDLLDKMERLSDPSCPTCHREFTNESEAKQLKKDLETLIEEIPKNVKGLQKRVSQEDGRYNELQNISPDYHKLKEIKQSIEDITKQVQGLDSELKQLKESRESTEIEFHNLSEKSDVLRGLSDDVQSIDNLTRDISGLQEKLEDVQQTCPVVQEGKGLEAVRKEVKEIGEKIKSTRKSCESKMDGLNQHRKLVNDLESAYNKLTNKKLEIESKQQQRANTLEKKAELDGKLSQIQSDIEVALQSIKPIKERLDSLEAERFRLKQRNDEEMDKLHAKIRSLESIKREVEKLDGYISDYEAGDNERLLQEAIQNKQDLTDDLDRIRSEREDLEKERRSILDDIANQDNVKRNLEDNMELRRLTMEINKNQDEVASLRQKLNTTDFIRVNEKKNNICLAMKEINADINSRLGTIAEMRKSVADIQRELNNPKLKNAARMYSKSRIRHETLTKAIDDLNQYYIALDMAITKFHREKMRLVNRIIREMWRNTYRGNDIDYIEIKTDDGELGGGADKRKSYNYRVVMVKNDVEMDMRGRCSAGQKVLASLIIRLALAETFSENCGIIALDEPTTNLDRENIESLANALSDIAENQAEQREFQLVIITHDEEFIEQLSRCDKIQYYQKVSRNWRGLSEIRKMNVSTLDGAVEI